MTQKWVAIHLLRNTALLNNTFYYFIHWKRETKISQSWNWFKSQSQSYQTLFLLFFDSGYKVLVTYENIWTYIMKWQSLLAKKLKNYVLMSQKKSLETGLSPGLFYWQLCPWKTVDMKDGSDDAIAEKENFCRISQIVGRSLEQQYRRMKVFQIRSCFNLRFYKRYCSIARVLKSQNALRAAQKWRHFSRGKGVKDFVTTVLRS